MEMNNYVEPIYPITRKEYFNEDNMKYLLVDERFNKNDRSRLSNYNKHRITGSSVMVEYKLADDVASLGLGRLYPSSGIGLQSYRFDLRNPLTEKWYFDIDMENSHPCIAEKLCDDYDLPHHNITNYINNREECLKIISSDRKTAKTEILKILYGGEIKLYKEHYELSDGELNPTSNLFLRNLQREFITLCDTIWERNPHLHKIKIGGKMLNKKPNCKVSLLSLILQTEERKLLMKIDYILNAKYNRPFGVFIHDGGLILKQEGETSFPQNILDDISQIITSSTRIKTRLTQKPITYDWEPVKKMCPYDNFKSEFEKTNFYVGSHIIHELDNGEIEFVKINDMKNRLLYQHWVESTEKGGTITHHFFEHWLEDETRAKYERMDFIPNREECPVNVYNRFKGFKAEKLESCFPEANDLTEIELKETIQPILDHILHLAGGENEMCSFLICIFANMIQNPHRKCEVAVLFRDENGFVRQGGGNGKSLFLNNFFGEQIIGEQYMIEIQDNADMYSTFNSQYAGKLLGIVEEAGSENHSNSDKLKNKISSRRINVNTKGVAQFTMLDYITYFFNSNNTNPFPIKQGNRRCVVSDVLQCLRGNETYFNNLVNCMNSPRCTYYFYLYLKKFAKTYGSPIQFQKNIPINSAYVQLLQLNAPLHVKWITYNVKHGLVENGSMRELYLNYVEWVKEHREAKNESILLSETRFCKTLDSDGNIIYSEDEHYCLLNVGNKKRNGTGKIYKWNITNLVSSLKDIHMLESNFEYTPVETIV